MMPIRAYTKLASFILVIIKETLYCSRATFVSLLRPLITSGYAHLLREYMAVRRSLRVYDVTNVAQQLIVETC